MFRNRDQWPMMFAAFWVLMWGVACTCRVEDETSAQAPVEAEADVDDTLAAEVELEEDRVGNGRFPRARRMRAEKARKQRKAKAIKQAAGVKRKLNSLTTEQMVEAAAPTHAFSVNGKPRHVVLVVIDTLRADVVAEVDTPIFDAIASRGSVKKMWTSSTWTAPSVISLFTGSSVREHGWRFPFPAQMNAKKHTYAKLPDVPVLAEVLGDAGFVTTGFYGNTLLHRRLGYNRGFKRWRFVGDRRLPSVVASEVAVWEEGERHFLYLHMFGAHQPLRPTAESKEKWGVDSKYIVPGKGFKLKKLDVKDKAGVEQYNLAYRAVVEDVDHRLGQVLAALGEHRADSLVIITSDHGELLGEHDVLGHGSFVWEPLTDVPFAVDGGGSVPARMTTASIADLVTRSVGVEHTWPVSVENPGPLVAQREGKIAFSTDGRFKGVWDSKNLGDGFAVFDLKKDVGETAPLGEEKEATLMSSRSAWESQVKEVHLASKEEAMSEELILALQELGYME